MVIVEINENGFKTTGTTDPSLEGFMASNMSAILFSAAQSATETMHKLNPAFKTSWETDKIFGGICATWSPSDEEEKHNCEGIGLYLESEGGTNILTDGKLDSMKIDADVASDIFQFGIFGDCVFG